MRPVGPLGTPLASSTPTGKVAASTGRSPVVTGLNRRWRAAVPSLPTLKRITALAPASIAFWILTAKSHWPRRISAIAPAGKPRKSPGWQPDVLPVGVGRPGVDGVMSPESGGARLPGVENWIPDAYDGPPTTDRIDWVRGPVYV